MTDTELRRAVSGRVLLPGEPEFEQAARPWNLAVTQRVAAVVEAADAADVAALVRYARQAGLTITAQPSGHGATGDADGVILLRTGRLDELTVHPDERWARVGAGVMWGRVQAEAGAHGLTGLAGSTPAVSVVGYLLGGGLSWFSRRYGWASGSVRAFEIVDTDGRQARVSAGSDAELFWALRGGGGDYAVVTAVEIDLYPAPSVYGGRIMWQGDRTREVFEAFRDLTDQAPPELSLWVNRLQIPQAPPMVALDATYLGDPDDGAALLDRLGKIDGVIADRRGVIAVADLGDITAEPVDPSPAASRVELLTGLDDQAIDTLLDEPMDPLLNVQLRHLGGALADPSEGAAGAVAEPYLLYMFGLGIPAVAAAVAARQAALTARLGAAVSGRKPYTFLAPGETAAQAVTEESLARLRELKRARDPQAVFRANFPV
ncbi:FAD-binding protein [Nonomuraea phyllanthi]|uniref:FAD-binding oxidoreductase n=1 Tax=Nonomuraea phyllanthi TaxID=2219224 RepID=UPI001293623C|nr:FAD-binding oxidoreductase [Nonomuraea phyllanthi]QFY09106.1 FAD-binding protein [Nonomuraea phyllanthi]